MVSFEKHGRGSDRWTAIKMAKDWVSKDFAILDTETTGLGPHARIVEISCIDRDGNVLVDSLVNPGIPIPADAEAIHGISDADAVDKPSFPALWPMVWNAVCDVECVLIYNAAYDCRLMRQSLEGRKTAIAQAEQLTCRCVMELYAQFYGQYSEHHGSYTWQKLVRAVSQCGLQMEGSAHRALADTWASLAVLNYMAALASE